MSETLEQKIQSFKEKYGNFDDDINPFSFEEVPFIYKVPIKIFKFREMKHNFKQGWETEYLQELYKNLHYGKVVMDIGAEQGEFTAFAASVVGEENVHIIEPSEKYWPNIRKVWEENFSKPPASCFRGFFSDINLFKYKGAFIDGWPECSNGEIFTDTAQIVIHDKDYSHIEKVSLDLYCDVKKIIPDILMIDCEGAEVDILYGSKNILSKYHPMLFVSVHSEEMISQYGRNKQELFDLINELGYESVKISEDHEEHWKFYKK